MLGETQHKSTVYPIYSLLAFLHAAVKDILVEKSSFTLVVVQGYCIVRLFSSNKT